MTTPQTQPETAPNPPPQPEKTKLLDRMIFETRWVLYPMNAGLMVALTIYLLKFLYQVFILLGHAPALITTTS
ncbi:MAG TPA: hypothetical protein PKA48_03045, partial [Candidatus Obscuribacter sp.]|nr:hypothetical protein [Candidatus Obscuribacter sp.]